MRRNEPTAVLALVLVTAVWGSTFYLIKGIVEVIPPVDFLGVRFLIAGALIAVVRARQLRRAPRAAWIRGGLLGLVYAGAQVLQTVGLQHTHASVSGFITGMYVVLTPIVLLVVFRVRIPAGAWIAILMATAGLMILSLHGFHLGLGESITLLGSLLYAIHIVLLGHWAPQGDALDLGAIQVMTVGVVCTLVALPGGVTLPQGSVQWMQVLYMALVAGLAAILAQTWAQSRMNAEAAAVVMTTEPLFAALFALLLGGEAVTVRLIVGGSLILGAMFVSEFAPEPTSTASPATPVKSEISIDGDGK